MRGTHIMISDVGPDLVVVLLHQRLLLGVRINVRPVQERIIRSMVIMRIKKMMGLRRRIRVHDLHPRINRILRAGEVIEMVLVMLLRMIAGILLHRAFDLVRVLVPSQGLLVAKPFVTVLAPVLAVLIHKRLGDGRLMLLIVGIVVVGRFFFCARLALDSRLDCFFIVFVRKVGRIWVGGLHGDGNKGGGGLIIFIGFN